MIAVGIIDTMGYISTIEALDVCLKTADVQLVSNKKGKGGMVSVIITGDVGSVTSAIEAGVAATQKLGGYHSHTIIARIDKQTGKLFGGPPSIPDPSSDDPSPDDPSPKPEPKSSLAATESASPKTVIAKREEEAPSTTSQASQAKPAETPPMKRTGKGTRESSDAKISQASESSKSKMTDKPSRASQSSRKKLPKKKPPKKK